MSRIQNSSITWIVVVNRISSTYQSIFDIDMILPTTHTHTHIVWQTMKMFFVNQKSIKKKTGSQLQANIDHQTNILQYNILHITWNPPVEIIDSVVSFIFFLLFEKQKKIPSIHSIRMLWQWPNFIIIHSIIDHDDAYA